MKKALLCFLVLAVSSSLTGCKVETALEVENVSCHSISLASQHSREVIILSPGEVGKLCHTSGKVVVLIDGGEVPYEQEINIGYPPFDGCLSESLFPFYPSCYLPCVVYPDGRIFQKNKYPRVLMEGALKTQSRNSIEDFKRP